ncbi:MAG: hypothetical protein R3D63_14810 [Paracoccaceae bacterium]
MSWRIFVHSVRQVFGNLDGALRVSGLLMIAQIVVMATIGKVMQLDEATMRQMMLDGTFPWGSFVVTVVLSTLLWLWMMVGWHRFVLLNERPALVPMLLPERILGYLGKSILIGLMLVPLVLVLSYAAGVLTYPMVAAGGGMSPVMGLVALLVVYVPAGTVAMRLSAALPGVALMPGVPLMTGWEATKGQTGAIVGVVALSAVMVFGLAILGGQLFPDAAGLPAVIYSGVTQWITALIGASVLTTLYGHFVERRPLI